MTVVPYVRVLAAPSFEPVTLAEARLWLRVDDDDTSQDAMILLLIAACRELAEEITGRAFVTRRLELRLDAFPADTAPIELPYPPLQSVDYLTYATGDGDVSLSGSPEAWLADTGSTPGRLLHLTGGSWPSALEQPGAVRIGYTAGYATPNEMPNLVRTWMQARIATLYEHREQLVMDNLMQIPRDFLDGLLDGLRVKNWFA